MSGVEIHNGILFCSCGGNNLHQLDVIVFNAGEEAPHKVRTTVLFYEGTTTVEPTNEGNPSGSRQGLIIRFRCESCHDGWEQMAHELGEEAAGPCPPLVELMISQHKGLTLARWRDAD